MAESASYEIFSAITKKLKCVVCRMTLIEPVKIKECGHSLCLMCMSENVFRLPTPSCPMDKTPITKIKLYDLDCECNWNKRSGMWITCPNNNCFWTGKLLEVKNHVWFGCRQKRLKSPPCQYGEKTTVAPESDEMESPALAKTCPQELISCEYKHLGCHAKIEKSQLESHMKSDMKRHLVLSCVKVEQQEQKIQLIRREQEKQLVALEIGLDKLMARCRSEKKETRFAWQISSLRGLLLAERQMFSEPFFLRGYKMILFVRLGNVVCGNIDVNSEYLCVGIHIIRGKYDKDLKWPFKTKLFFALAEHGLNGAKSLSRISLQPDTAIKMPECQIDDKLVAEKPMKPLAKFFLIKESVPKHYISVELGAERE